MYLHLFSQTDLEGQSTFTYSLLRWVSRLGTCPSTWYCDPKGGSGVHMKQESCFKCLPWPGLGPCSLMAANITTRLQRTPSFHTHKYIFIHLIDLN